MRRWSWVVAIMLVVSLVLAGCGKKDAAAIVKELDGKVSSLDSYHGKGVMTLKTGMEPQEYLVEVCYQTPHYYRISMKNAKKDITQIVLRNDDGVFVLTPHLNKSFRFQSDWPENQGQVYLYQSLVQSIVMDQERQFVEDENAYVFDVVANYQNGSLARQKIWLDKKTYEPQHVEVSDSNANVLMEVKFDEFEFGTKFEKDQFDMQRNMTSWHIQSLPTMGQETGGQAAGEHGHSGSAAGEASGGTAQGTNGTAAESAGGATAGNGAGAGKEGTGAASGAAAEGAGSGAAADAGASVGKEGTGAASGTAAEGAGSGAAADVGASVGKEGTGAASGAAAEGAGSGTASDVGHNGSGDIAGTAGASSDASNGAKGDSAAQGTAGANAQSNPGGSPSAKPQSFGVIEPRYIPSGVKKQDVTDVKLGEEMGVMIRYSGDYNFTLVESRPTTQTVSVLPAEPVDLGFTWGVLAGDEKKTLMWTNDGVEFRLSTADLELTEMIKIAQSVEGESGK
ncbi:outer membrane lipoprotein-sorting protein [Paenibacillus ginsengihumi]|uniref:outer membrane lipoprotein-sorting protein n=1 Tax=Paenibacillus ginsengihumi TaxID=431596 RepID=UPI00036386EA|nr:outer membrane lipoprotein-sorting protein [Paenibacillus ginsengihumi]